MAKKTTLGFSDPNAASGKLEMVSVDLLEPYPDHPFEAYTGEQLDRIFHNVIANKLNVDQPIIVRRIKGTEQKYQILSGHNRTKASKRADLETIPAVIFDELSDDEAIRIINESNIAQRSFESWLPSEKAKSIAQYHKSIKNQGKRLAEEASNVTGEVNQKLDARKKTAEVYDIGENVVRTYLKINNLIDPLKKRLDRKEYGLTPATNLSWIPTGVQEIINAILDEDEDMCIVTLDNSKKLRSSFEKCNVDCLDEDKTKEQIRSILTLKDNGVKKTINSDTIVSGNRTIIEFPTETYTRLFQDETDYNRIVAKIAKAIEFYEKHQSTQNLATV